MTWPTEYHTLVYLNHAQTLAHIWAKQKKIFFDKIQNISSILLNAESCTIPGSISWLHVNRWLTDKGSQPWTSIPRDDWISCHQPRKVIIQNPRYHFYWVCVVFTPQSRFNSQDWTDSSAATSACCFCRGPQFESLHTHGASQPAITPVPMDLVPSSGLCGYPACMWYTYVHADKILIKIWSV